MATLDAILRIAAQTSGVGEVRALQGALGGLSKTAATVQTALAGLTGVGAILGAGLSVAGLAAASKGIVDMADSLDELSQRTGTSVETLSKLGLAARQSGLDTEQVSVGMVKLSRNLGEIAVGGGEKAAAALSILGISAKDASGNLKTADQVLLEVADRFKEMPDGVTKAKLTMDLFGRGSAALIPMLNMGSDAIERLNTGISADFAKNAGIYNDQLANLQAQASALGASVLDALLPSLIKVTAWTATSVENLRGWVVANRETIVAFVTGAGDAAKSLVPLAVQLGTLIGVWKSYRIAMQLASAAQVLFMRLTPVGAAALAAGLAIGAVAAASVAKEMAEIEKRAKEAGVGGNSLAQSIIDAGKAADDLSQDQVDIAAAAAAAAAAAEQQKAATEALRKTEEDRAYWLERAGSAYAKQAAQIDLISAANQRRTALAGEENTLAQAYNNLGKTILQNRLELAKTDEEKLAISKQIAQIESESARLQLEATKLQIQAEQELKAAALNRAISNRKEIESTMALAAAMYNAGQLGMDKIQTYRQELEKATRAADTAQLEFNQAQRINNVKTQAANINYQASVLQATGGTQQAGGYIETAGPAYTTDKPRSYVTIAGMRIPQYAQGGFVTRRTLAEIGEGGEPEYVVPQSKAKGFANNILRGVVGGAALSSSGGSGGGGGASSTKQYGYATDRYGNKWSLDPAAYRGKSLRITAYDTSEEVGSPRWQLKMSQMTTGTTSKISTLSGPGGMSGMKKLQRAQTQAPKIIIQTGPVQRRNDGDFVTLSDLEKAVASSVDQTMAAVQKTARQPGFKRRTGTR